MADHCLLIYEGYEASFIAAKGCAQDQRLLLLFFQKTTDGPLLVTSIAVLTCTKNSHAVGRHNSRYRPQLDTEGNKPQLPQLIASKF